MSYLIIGAGPCGLAMARHLKAHNIPYVQVDSNEDIGGNWFNGVYKGVYTDACKDVMQYSDFPMPKAYPDFISGQQMYQYLSAYADHFSLREGIRFNTTLQTLKQNDNKTWRALFEGSGDEEDFEGVIVCNGHHREMRWPELPGEFSGEYLHAKQYKSPEQLHNKRVLVIGSGNSAADIACEAARVGLSSTLSFRDSPWIFPKTFMGVPLGRIRVRNYPNAIQRLLSKLLIRLTFGQHRHYHLPEPRHKLFEKHPTVSEELPYYLKHGRVNVKPEIASVSGQTVQFKDGSAQTFDLIVAATGYHLRFPFLEPSLARVEAQNLQCIGHCVYPEVRGLYFMGWQQVRGGVGSLSYLMAQMITDLIRLDQSTGVWAGQIFSRMGDPISTTNLYGNQAFLKFVKRHSYDRMKNIAERLR